MSKGHTASRTAILPLHQAFLMYYCALTSRMQNDGRMMAECWQTSRASDDGIPKYSYRKANLPIFAPS
jgi:hypothetical protein